MTSLGFIPSQTSVTVTIDGPGNNAKIPSATPQSAGVMTAEQSRVVEQVRLLLAGGNFAPSNVTPLGQQSPVLPIGDLSLPSPPEILPPNHTDDLARRVAALERRVSSAGDAASLTNAVSGLRDQVAARLTAIETRLANLEAGGPSDEVDALKQEVAEMRPMLMIIKELIEDPTPVLVEGTNG